MGAVCVLQPVEIYVDDEAKLTLHGLVQHYIMLNEEEKNRKLNDLLDALDFNQVRSLQSTQLVAPMQPPASELSLLQHAGLRHWPHLQHPQTPSNVPAVVLVLNYLAGSNRRCCPARLVLLAQWLATKTAHLHGFAAATVSGPVCAQAPDHCRPPRPECRACRLGGGAGARLTCREFTLPAASLVT